MGMLSITNLKQKDAVDALQKAMISGNETEKIILEGFRNLSDRKKERILGYLAALQED